MRLLDRLVTTTFLRIYVAFLIGAPILFWILLLALGIGVQLDIVPLPNTLGSTVLGVLVLFIWPGALLTCLAVMNRLRGRP